MEIKHAKLKAWVEDMAAMCRPDKVVWIDGSRQRKGALKKKPFQPANWSPWTRKNFLAVFTTAPTRAMSPAPNT